MPKNKEKFSLKDELFNATKVQKVAHQRDKSFGS
jgi:hypothetical protein